MSKENNYTGVRVFEGLAGLRERRSMYIGSTGILSEFHAPRGLTQLSQEIMSNSIDEYVEGYGHEIEVIIHEDQSMTVIDYGRGLPKGPGQSFEEVIKSATIPHASGKIRGEGYTGTGIAGMNGIGLKVTNATSRFVDIEAVCYSSKRDKNDDLVLTGGLEHYHIKFEGEEIVHQEIIQSFKANEIEKVEGSTNQYMVKSSGEMIMTGTKITFLPDDGPVFDDNPQPVFESINWVKSDLFPRLESAAFLNAGLTIKFTDMREKLIDEKTGEELDQHFYQEWFYENGLVDYIHIMSEGARLIDKAKAPLVIEDEIEYEGNVFAFQGALLFTEDFDTVIHSYANGVPTKEGGPHEDGFRAGLVRAVNNFIKDTNVLPSRGKKDIRLNDTDVLEGLYTAFQIKVPQDMASFEGQTKEKLGTAQASKVTNDIIYSHVTTWLYDNPQAAKQVVTRMNETRQNRESITESKKASRQARQASPLDALAISGKLKRATVSNPEINELYLMEGDSAAGIDRNAKFQAIFPLRGKPLNAYDLKVSEILKNEEYSTIVSELGAGIQPEFDLESLRYDKVIIGADADDDGAHIRLLLTGFFYLHMRPLVEAGKLYSVKTPLYKATKYIKGQPHTLLYYTEQDMKQVADKLESEGYGIKRYKGLGEMDGKEAAMAITNVEHRQLERITVEDAEMAAKILRILLGPDARLRREWISENIDFDEVEL